MRFAADGSTQTDGFTMPFGKHKGKPLDDVPRDYLAWVLDNVDLSNRPTLRQLIRNRLGLDGPPGGWKPDDLDAAVRRWYRELALDFHPDRRGNHEAMIAVNEAHERLRKILGI